MEVKISAVRQLYFDCDHKPQRGSLVRLPGTYSVEPMRGGRLVRRLVQPPWYGYIDQVQVSGSGWLVTCTECDGAMWNDRLEDEPGAIRQYEAKG